MNIEGLFFPMKVLLKNSVFSIRMCYLLSRLKTLNSMSFLLRFAIEIFFWTVPVDFCEKLRRQPS